MSRCPNAGSIDDHIDVQLSCDGVSECRSNSISMDIYSTKVKGCQQVYPLRIIRPIDKTYVGLENHLQSVIDEMNLCFMLIKQYIADNPKRALAKMCLNHASVFPCEYCFARGSKNECAPKDLEIFRKKMDLKKVLINEKIADLKSNPNSSKNEIKTLEAIAKELNTESKKGPQKKHNVVWPASSREGEPRTDPKVQEIIAKIEENPALDKEEKKGIVGRSPLWDIPNFNFTRDSPCEYMHIVCIGVVKRLVILTFSVGEVRPRITKRKLSPPNDFNTLMLETRLTREFSRRARKLDLAVMKAQEMRNIAILYFPHVLQCIEPNAKERRLWLCMAYTVRSCLIPSKEFSVIDLDSIEVSSREFYTLYEKLFGATNCSYSTHVFGSHAIDMRAHGPLSETSAFAFESFYGEVRNAFTPGTQSTLKQIMEKILLKRAISYHCCKNTLHFSDQAHDSPQECNSLVYCYEANAHKMYQIVEVHKESLLCYKQGKFVTTFKDTQNLNLNWSHVGVYKKGGLMTTTLVEVPKTQVCGKVLSVGEYLITCPTNVLLEK